MVPNAAIERFFAAPLLEEVEPEARRAVVDVMKEVRADRGATLLEQGQANGRLSFMIDGTAEIIREFPHGHSELVASLTAPAAFGTTSFFRPDPPTVSVKATSPVWLLTLEHADYERLRRENTRAAEALALAAVRVLSERFDMLDQKISAYIREHDREHEQNGHPGRPKATEWSAFRAKLFEEANF